MFRSLKSWATVLLLAGHSILLSHTRLPAAELNVLFLGDQGPHRPSERYEQLAPVMEERGIHLRYTEQVSDLNPAVLSQYDAVVLYANIDEIEPNAAEALLAYVAGGGGFVPLHCASFCFRNSDEIVDLVGAQFQRHEWARFRTTIDRTDHPVMQGFSGFESEDETYVHTKHNEQDRVVLSYRVDPGGREPWTWVRTHGQGRVFYTAWGHDHRTWGHPGFHNLVERGIRWAAGDDPALAGEYSGLFPIPEMTPQRTDVEPFEYIDAGGRIPNYLSDRSFGREGDAFTKMQQPLAAAESIKHIVVPQRFRVELFAAEPDLGGKPISMAWDERGRLWVSETVDYPNELKPPGDGRDRIRICEDTDGDWRADKFTIFAEDLSIPTSLTFARGGVIVHNGKETLFLEDTDGDDRADVRKVFLEAWDQGDTHGGPSNLQYGLDNWIWGMQGYNNSNIVIDGRQQRITAGFHRFRPDGSAIEFLRSTNNNTWGLGISEEGIVFGSTANRNPSVYMPVPNRYYEAVRGWRPSLVLGTIADTHLFQPIVGPDRVRQVDHHGGYTAGAGHALYTARTYPQEYWNRTALVNGPTGHLVGTFILSADGSDFTSTNPFNLFASDDEWTAPIMAEVGPDGNVWVLDWYNYIVQHNPTPEGFETGKGNAYETPLRDKTHGRIYRVVYEPAAPFEQMSLAGADASRLVQTLRHDNMLWRKHAQRLLVERGQPDVAGALVELVRDQSTDAIGLNTGAIHALWTLHGLGLLDGSHEAALAAAVEALGHPSAGVRRNAALVLPPSAESVAAILQAGLLEDDEAQVRLAALMALADGPDDAAAGEAIAHMMARPENLRDRWMPDAATSAAATSDNSFLHAALGSQITGDDDPRLEMVSVVAEHLARGGDAAKAMSLAEQLTAAPVPLAEAAVAGLAAGWPPEHTLSAGSDVEDSLKSLMDRVSLASQGKILKLAAAWQIGELNQYAERLNNQLMARLDDEDLSERERLEAAEQLVGVSIDEIKTAQCLLDRVGPQASPDLAEGIVAALNQLADAAVGEVILERLDVMVPSLRAVSIGVLLDRAEWIAVLLSALENGRVRIGELSLEQREMLSSHPDRPIRLRMRDVLVKGDALPNPDRAKVIEELQAITHAGGDHVAGKQVFTKHCATCHLHRGEGTDIGPDLSGMAVHPKQELLVQLLDPNRSVEGNFRSYVLTTAAGRTLSGLLAAESQTTIELYDAEGKKHVVLREDIDELSATSKSLMPEGFERLMSRQELTDLLAFLAHRDKYVPLDLQKVASTSSAAGFGFGNRRSRRDGPGGRRAGRGRGGLLELDDWGPKEIHGVPFYFIDPDDGQTANIIMLRGRGFGRRGDGPPTLPIEVELPCNMPARAIHMLSGINLSGAPRNEEESVSLLVRLHYADGQKEDHELLNGVHFASFFRQFDVPKSEFALDAAGRQIRYLAIEPEREEVIERIELIKDDDTSPIVVAITVEGLE